MCYLREKHSTHTRICSQKVRRHTVFSCSLSYGKSFFVKIFSPFYRNKNTEKLGNVQKRVVRESKFFDEEAYSCVSDWEKKWDWRRNTKFFHISIIDNSEFDSILTSKWNGLIFFLISIHGLLSKIPKMLPKITLPRAIGISVNAIPSASSQGCFRVRNPIPRFHSAEILLISVSIFLHIRDNSHEGTGLLSSLSLFSRTVFIDLGLSSVQRWIWGHWTIIQGHSWLGLGFRDSEICGGIIRFWHLFSAIHFSR